MNQSDVYTWATDGFTRFTETWEFEDFWTRGNTFEACLRFVMAGQAKWPKDPKVREMAAFLEQMIATNERYLRSKLKCGWWADDFGWWGIGALAARNYLMSIGDTQLADHYLELAESCWSEMIARGYDSSDAALPVPHGCQNSGSTTDPGTKNTVTNANLFVLSLRLYGALKTIDKQRADRYLGMSYSQYLWFSRWFESSYGYLRLAGPGDGGLVQERPIASPDYERRDRPQWEAGWAWTGDQGLMLGALVGIFQIRDELHDWLTPNRVPDFDPDAFEAKVAGWIKVIATGIKSLLFGAAFDGSDYVLREAPFTSSYIADPKDYVCGRGVLLRYLSEDTVTPFLGDGFQDGVAATAKALWDGRDRASNQFGARWSPDNDASFNEQFARTWGDGDVGVSWSSARPTPPCDGILQATGLDVLGAAIPILG